MKFVWPCVAVVSLCTALVTGVTVRDAFDRAVPVSLGSLETSRSLLASKTDQRGAVPAGDYFYDLSELVHKQYVDGVKDDEKLATGAVRGMIASLVDPDSYFMSPEQNKLFQAQRRGEYQGIGIEAALVFTPEQQKTLRAKRRVTDFGLLVPTLVVTTVLPGSPAEKAGMKFGDRIRSVDDKWAVTLDTVKEFRKLQAEVAAGKLPAAEIDELRKQLKEQAKDGITAGRAREKLITGVSGTVKVEWTRGTTPMTAVIAKSKTLLSGIQPSGSQVMLRFQSGADQQLRQALQGKSEITLDLRQSGEGDPTALQKIFEVVAPKGKVGVIVSERGHTATDVLVKIGNSKPPKLTLIVDGSTRGCAEIFALALSAKGLAKLQGSGMADDRIVTEYQELPDGSAYVLATGIFRPNLASKVGAAK